MNRGPRAVRTGGTPQVKQEECDEQAAGSCPSATPLPPLGRARAALRPPRPPRRSGADSMPVRHKANAAAERDKKQKLARPWRRARGRTGDAALAGANGARSRYALRQRMAGGGSDGTGPAGSEPGQLEAWSWQWQVQVEIVWIRLASGITGSLVCPCTVIRPCLDHTGRDQRSYSKWSKAGKEERGKGGEGVSGVRRRKDLAVSRLYISRSWVILSTIPMV